MSLFKTIRAWARRIRRDALTLWFACRDPRTPWLVKVLCAAVAAYALSPIDLIPDFIPILGYVDDALLLPALIWLAIRLLPPDIVDANRLRADAWLASRAARPKSYAGAAFIVMSWLAAGGWVVWWLWNKG